MDKYESATAFERAAKRRQKGFRDASRCISDRGRSPTDGKGKRNGHLLALGCEEENLFPAIRYKSGATDFFRERGIKWWKSARSGDDTERNGPTRNMASSQVACVNFLMPLVDIPGALLSMLSVLDDDVRDVVTILHDGHESPVEFEWIGECCSLEGGKNRGANNTSIDAFLIAETKAEKRRAYLLEWKYVEQYLRNSARPDFKGEGKSGVTRRRRYTDRFSRSALTIPIG